MGRPPKNKNQEVVENVVDTSLETAIQKEFGQNVIVDGNYIVQQKKTIIPFSPALDSIIGGGINSGSVVILTGKPKVGKSTCALFFAANAQKPEFGGKYCTDGREIFYYNAESRLKARDIESIKHLNKDKFHVIQSQPGHILTASSFLEIANNLINSKLGSVHIIDSFSAMITDAEMTGSMSDVQRCDSVKILAKFARKISNIVAINDIIVIGVTHLMASPTCYGGWQEKSGMALQYLCDVRLRCVGCREWKLNNDGVPIGMESDWIALNTSLNTPPFGKATSFIRYGEGIDIIKEVLTLSIDLGLIKKSGMWIEFEDGQKAQGIENARQIVINTPDLYDELYNKVKKVLNF